MGHRVSVCVCVMWGGGGVCAGVGVIVCVGGCGVVWECLWVVWGIVCGCGCGCVTDYDSTSHTQSQLLFSCSLVLHLHIHNNHTIVL